MRKVGVFKVADMEVDMVAEMVGRFGGILKVICLLNFCLGMLQFSERVGHGGLKVKKVENV